MVTYAAVVWWPHADHKGAGKQLEYIQRLACLYITGAVRSAPTSALEIIVGIVPLPIYIKQEAMLACYRMQLNHQWVQTCWGRTGIKKHLNTSVSLSLMKSDKIATKFLFDKNYVVSIPHPRLDES